MGWLDELFNILTWGPAAEVAKLGNVAEYIASTAPPGGDGVESILRARRQLAIFGIALVGLVGAPTLYAWHLKNRKGKKHRAITDKDEMIGKSLENSSTQATGVLMTALAAPAISTATAYVIVQKLEDARIISKGLGDAAQGLLTVAAAGPMIQGIGQIATSAFKKGK
jgi:hypothetical protein